MSASAPRARRRAAGLVVRLALGACRLLAWAGLRAAWLLWLCLAWSVLTAMESMGLPPGRPQAWRR